MECGDYDVADTYDVKKKEEEMENNWANDPPHPGSWSQTASGQLGNGSKLLFCPQTLLGKDRRLLFFSSVRVAF